MTGMGTLGRRRSKKTRGLLLAVAIFVAGEGALLAPSALGDPEPRQAAEEAGKPHRKQGGREPSAKSALRMEEVEIYGDVEKPKTMFVIPRTPFRYSRKDQEKDFTKEILDPMTKERLEDTERWRGAVSQP